MPNRKHSKEDVEKIKQALLDFIEDEDDPMLAKFLSFNPVALKHWVTQDDLNNYREFRPAVERAIKKQEAYVLQKGMNGQSTAMSIFRLKQPQFGYRDKFEQDITSNGEKVQFVNTVPRPSKEVKKQRPNRI